MKTYAAFATMMVLAVGADLGIRWWMAQPRPATGKWVWNSNVKYAHLPDWTQRAAECDSDFSGWTCHPDGGHIVWDGAIAPSEGAAERSRVDMIDSDFCVLESAGRATLNGRRLHLTQSERVVLHCWPKEIK